MSVGRPNPYEYISPVAYENNQAIIKKAKAAIKTFEDMNESGRKKFQERESQLEQARKELQRKIEEGEQAKRLLEQLDSQPSSGSTSQELVPSSSARIEEVATNDDSNQVALGSGSASSPINAVPQGESQPPSTQHDFSRNLGGHFSPWIPSQQQQPAASYYGQPLPPSYRPSPTEQLQRQRETLSSQNTAGGVRHDPSPNIKPPPAVPLQPYGPVLGQTTPVYGYAPQPFSFYKPPLPGQQHAGQASNSPRHPAAFASTSTTGGSFGQPNNRKASSGRLPTSSNTTSPALDRDARRPSHAPPKSTESGRTIQNLPPGAPIMRPADKLKEIVESFAHKLSENDIRRNHEEVKKWAEKALPGAYSNFLTMRLVKDQQGQVHLQFGNYGINVDHFFEALLRRKGIAMKPTSAVPTEESQPMPLPTQRTRPPLENAQKPPTAAASSTSAATFPSHPPATPTTPAAANLPQPPQATPTVTIPVQSRPFETTRNSVALPSPSQANRKRLARDILFALGKRKQPSSASDSTEQPTKKRAPEPSASSTGRSMKFIVNGVPSTTTQVSSKASEPDKLMTRPTPMTDPSLPVALQMPAQELPAGPLLSISKTRAPQAGPIPTSYTPYGVNLSKAVPQTAKASGFAVPSKGEFRVAASSLSQTTSTTSPASNAEGSPSSGPSQVARLPLTQPIAGPSVSGPSKTGPSTQTMPLGPATSGSTSSSMSHPLEPVQSLRTSSASSTSLLSIPSHSPPAAAPLATSGSEGLSPPTPPSQTALVASTSVTAGGVTYSQPPVSISSADATSTQNSGVASPARKGPSQVQREPLFLPSSVSPEPEPFQIADSPEIGANASSSAAELNQHEKRKNFAYVLLPPPPEYLIRDRSRGEGQSGPRSQQSVASDSDTVLNKPRKDRTRTSSVSTSVVGEEDYDKIESRHDRTIDKDELNAVLLSCSRLQELPCRWDGCDVQMNSVDSLIRHLNQHKPRASSNNPYFTCRWTQCGRRCTFKEKHLEKHATLPLRCAYADCDDSFRTAGQLVKHFQAKHTDDVLKPVAGIHAPRLETPPPAPETVPSYMLVTRAVLPQKIPRERHKLLMPWVVRNIVSSDHEVRAAKRIRKTARPINRDAPPAGGPSSDYEFLKTRSTRYSTWLSRPVDIKLDDLDSEEVSRMVDEGLLLWGPAEVGIFGAEGRGNINDADPPAPPLALTPTLPSKGPAEIKTEWGEGELPRSGTPGLHHDNGHNSDEDMVEDMLRGTPVQ